MHVHRYAHALHIWLQNGLIRLIFSGIVVVATTLYPENMSQIGPSYAEIWYFNVFDGKCCRRLTAIQIRAFGVLPNDVP